MYEAIAGYGLGGSSVALFGRVGVGTCTKAADVGADSFDKNDYGLDGIVHCNPVCMAVDECDNVADFAGVGADLFKSIAESTRAALVLVASTPDMRKSRCGQLHSMLNFFYWYGHGALDPHDTGRPLQGPEHG